MENNKEHKILNAPALRFPEFEGEWETVTLGDVATVIKERISSSNLTVNDYVATENMKSHFGGVVEASSIPNNTNVIYFKKGDILISNIRPYLRKVWAATNDGGCSADVFVFRATKISVSFLYYIMANDSFIDYVMSGAKGVKMPRGDKEQMLKYTFAIPALKEQNKISRLISLLDQRISTQIRAIEKLESLMKGLLGYLFKTVKSNAHTFLLGDICNITTGKLDANAMVKDGEYAFFTCAEKPYRIDKYAFDTEALLVSGNGNVGYINYYKGKFNAYQRTYVLSDFSHNISYIKYYLKAHLHARIDQEKNIGNIPYIVLSTLADMKIMIPHANIVDKIVRLLDSVEGKISRESNLLNHYINQKQYLLQEMFI